MKRSTIGSYVSKAVSDGGFAVHGSIYGHVTIYGDLNLFSPLTIVIGIADAYRVRTVMRKLCGIKFASYLRIYGIVVIKEVVCHIRS
uniref:DUF2179 domain-containing protein n=1 Tax=Angiostrongylus cantonensis TaxID=6313 RepID=A0A0K0D2S1_ANGCA